ncbi:hypothetical protein [Brachyspira pilosicoli]|uniref:hypothetical protein n=1 Tax=Brachyspira pilosicoli TaxID=52584 RepID=UPI001CA5D779|nr:hypothetical protein [Brachyspira pilosicoli]MBW5397786.1 hypothetical protein [Brachyspira pilosicoli]
MKKLILILTALCITFAYSFAQIPTANMNTFIDNLDSSAVKRATAGEFSTDSDKLNAKDVFDLNRTIFSAGYVPGFNSSDSTAVQAFFGVPILNNAMYFGVAGVYSMNETRVDYNPYSANASQNGITLGKEVTTGSTFAIRPVFKINDMVSIHYLIARGNSKQVNEGYTSFIDDKNLSVITNTTGNSQWVHEVAVGLVFGEMKLKIPVRLTINDAGNSYSKQYSLTKTDVANQYSEETQTGYTNTGNNTMNLSIAPEFSMPLVAGPMTGLNFGLTLGFDIYGMGQKFDGYNTIKNTPANGGTATETKTSIATNQEGVFNMNADINAYPTLEWSLADNRVRLIMEPKVGLAINVTNAGNVKVVEKTEITDQTTLETTTTSGAKSSLVQIIPYIELPIGTAFKPVDWFEFRAGVSYRLGFAMTTGSYEALTGGKYKTFGYDSNNGFESRMNLYTGMGFIVGEDFFIDLFLAARAGTAGTTTPSPSLLGIDSWGAQLSYRL